MAIKTSKKITPTKNVSDDTPEFEEVDEAEDVTSTETAEDTAPDTRNMTPPPSASVRKNVDPLTDLVRIAVHKLISPAPRVGNVCMVRDLSVTELKPGIHAVPRVVAEVLVDRRKASYV